MEESNKNQTFNYAYSAKEQEELRKIRQKYTAKEETKLEQLRRLDKSVFKKGATVSIIIGIIGALILGVGMCCVLVWQNLFVYGIVIGIVGIAIVSAAYPIYNYVTKKEREKIAPEIIRLTNELMQ